MKRKRIPFPLKDGKNIWLERLTPRMLIDLSDTLWLQKRNQLIEDMNAAEVESSDKLVALETLDKKRGMYSELLYSSRTLDGCSAIIDIAASAAAADTDIDFINNCNLTPNEIMVVACDLLGYDVSDESDEGDEIAKKNDDSQKSDDHNG